MEGVEGCVSGAETNRGSWRCHLKQKGTRRKVLPALLFAHCLSTLALGLQLESVVPSRAKEGPERKAAGDQHRGLPHVLKAYFWSRSVFGCCFHEGKSQGSFSVNCRWQGTTVYFGGINTLKQKIMLIFISGMIKRLNTGVHLFINTHFFVSVQVHISFPLTCLQFYSLYIKNIYIYV